MREGRIPLAVAACLTFVITVIGTTTVAVAGTAPSKASPSNGRSCSRPFTTTLIETSKVRVFATPEEEGPSAHHEPAFAGRPVFGCLKANGKSRLLDLPEADSALRPIWVGVNPAALSASGPLVAFAYTQYYRDTHGTWIRVRNLRTGRVFRSCFAGGDLDPRRDPFISEIGLGDDGVAVWGVETSQGPRVESCGPSGPTILDESEGVEPESLYVEGDVAHWSDDGQAREAEIGGS